MKRSISSTRQAARSKPSRLPDEVDFEVEQFNKGVVTVPFNRAVAEELAKYIDPAIPTKR